MKKICKITVVLLLFILSIKIHAQQIDTLQYLKETFEAKKADYIGKPFSCILNKMDKIYPQSVFSMPSVYNITLTEVTKFYFILPKQGLGKNVIYIYIKWETPIPTKDVDNTEKIDKSGFTPEKKVFYGSKIVKDLKIIKM